MLPVTSPPWMCATGMFMCAPATAAAKFAPMSKPERMRSGVIRSNASVRAGRTRPRDRTISAPVSGAYSRNMGRTASIAKPSRLITSMSFPCSFRTEMPVTSSL